MRKDFVHEKTSNTFRNWHVDIEPLMTTRINSIADVRRLRLLRPKNLTSVASFVSTQ